MTDSTKEDGFDPAAWENAYQHADLDPQLKTIAADIEDDMARKNIPGQVLNVEGALDLWDQQDRDQMNLIHAELGDDTFVFLNGEKGNDVWDIAGNRYTWPAFVGKAEAYRRKGDEDSVDKMLSIFPEHSQLKEQLIERIKNIRVEPDYNGSDSTADVGKLIDIKIGNQYDIRPGKIDFRHYVKDGVLDNEAAASAILDTLRGKDPIYAEDWEEVTHTLNNINKEFGDEGRERFWVVFEKQFREEEAVNERSK